jgi:hypothetical protein
LNAAIDEEDISGAYLQPDYDVVKPHPQALQASGMTFLINHRPARYFIALADAVVIPGDHEQNAAARLHNHDASATTLSQAT